MFEQSRQCKIVNPVSSAWDSGLLNMHGGVVPGSRKDTATPLPAKNFKGT